MNMFSALPRVQLLETLKIEVNEEVRPLMSQVTGWPSTQPVVLLIWHWALLVRLSRLLKLLLPAVNTVGLELFWKLIRLVWVGVLTVAAGVISTLASMISAPGLIGRLSNRAPISRVVIGRVCAPRVTLPELFWWPSFFSSVMRASTMELKQPPVPPV
ncbi:hypothetical protein D3C80_777520 [compost metagenome]